MIGEARFVGLDPWAAGRPRRRDIAGLLSGLFALGAVLVWRSLAEPVVVTPVAVVSGAERERLARTIDATNAATARLGVPWPLWLRDTLIDLPPGAAALQVDIDPQAARLRLVLDVGEFALAEVAIQRLEARARFAAVRIVAHERAPDGRLRVSLEGRIVAESP